MVQVGDSCGRWGVEDGWIDGEKVRDDGCAVGYPAVGNAVTGRAYRAPQRCFWKVPRPREGCVP